MSKFKKRIQKTFATKFNAVVYGTGFGYLDEILDIFPTVFVLSDTPPVKKKNLVFRENGSDLNILQEVKVIFIDRNKVDDIDYLLPIIKKHKPDIAIEGNEPLEREYSKSIYASGYFYRESQGIFHIWKLGKK